jgi:hypothetical protein
MSAGLAANVFASGHDSLSIEPSRSVPVGLFSQGGHAGIWLSDDARRLLVQMKTHFSIISLRLFLRKIRNDSARPAPSMAP